MTRSKLYITDTKIVYDIITPLAVSASCSKVLSFREFHSYGNRLSHENVPNQFNIDMHSEIYQTFSYTHSNIGSVVEREFHVVSYSLTNLSPKDTGDEVRKS